LSWYIKHCLNKKSIDKPKKSFTLKVWEGYGIVVMIVSIL
jgi:hypothetical protein